MLNMDTYNFLTSDETSLDLQNTLNNRRPANLAWNTIAAWNDRAGKYVAHHRNIGRKSAAKYKDTDRGGAQWIGVTAIQPAGSHNPVTPWRRPSRILSIKYRQHMNEVAPKTQKEKGGRGGVKKKK